MKKSRLFFIISVIVIFCFTFSSCEKLLNKGPEMEDQIFSIDENSPTGTIIAQVLINDEAGQERHFSIIAGNDDGLFALTEREGYLKVNNSTLLDYETVGTRTLQVEIEDEFGKTDNSEITIALINLPEISNQTFAIDENSDSGTLVGKILTLDENLTFSIVSGNTNNAFSISNDGSITVNNEATIDYESIPSFSLNITAVNNQNKSASAVYTVNLVDVIPPTNGLILYMPFDGDINDYSTSLNNGIDYSTGMFINGKWGQAKEFNGTSDYLELTNTLNTSVGLSFSFWIKTYGAIETENNGVIITKYSMTGPNRCLLMCSFGANALRSIDRVATTFYSPNYVVNTDHDHTMSYLLASDLTAYSNPSLWTISNSKKLTVNTWTHCIVNMTSSSLEIWLDGVLCTKKTREYAIYANTSIPTYIGNLPYGGAGSNNHFHGSLDEFRVYNRSLTENEIKTLLLEK